MIDALAIAIIAHVQNPSREIETSAGDMEQITVRLVKLAGGLAIFLVIARPLITSIVTTRLVVVNSAHIGVQDHKTLLLARNGDRKQESI